MGSDLIINSCCGTDADTVTSDIDKQKTVRQDKSVVIPPSDEQDVINSTANQYVKSNKK